MLAVYPRSVPPNRENVGNLISISATGAGRELPANGRRYGRLRLCVSQCASSKHRAGSPASIATEASHLHNARERTVSRTGAKVGTAYAQLPLHRGSDQVGRA